MNPDIPSNTSIVNLPSSFSPSYIFKIYPSFIFPVVTSSSSLYILAVRFFNPKFVLNVFISSSVCTDILLFKYVSYSSTGSNTFVVPYFIYFIFAFWADITLKSNLLLSGSAISLKQLYLKSNSIKLTLLLKSIVVKLI